MPVLDAREIDRSYDQQTILANAAMTIDEGERVGLVGNNGSGKSTLGRILSGREKPDSGTLAQSRGTRIDYLEQEPVLTAGSTVLEVVSESLVRWTAARNRHDAVTEAMAHPDAADKIEDLIRQQASAADEIEREGGWERLHEAEAILGNLGIDDSSRRVDTLSGGERRRVALARILVDAPDLAILDEPTNHLDITTIEWLEDYLRNRFRGALLLITHDRRVLENVTDRTLEIHAGKINSYAGGYVAYLEARAERAAHEERTEKNRQNFLRRELEWLRRSPQARTTKQKARIDRVENIRDQAGPEKQKKIEMQAQSRRLGKTILEVAAMDIHRDGKDLVSDLTFALGAGERIGIVGPNGTGKTSLFLTILEEISPASGSLTIGTNTRIGYLDQNRGGLEPAETIYETLSNDRQQVKLGSESLGIAAYLERFLFDRHQQRSRIGTLSGGERARVCLARLLADESNLLLLDEPTNDLDTTTLAALEEMLLNYAGSALVVSHDRWFLDRIATSILAFEGNGRVELHAGNYSEYRERKAALPTRAKAKSGASSPKPAIAKTPTRAKKLSFKEERELEAILASVEIDEGRIHDLEARLADPETYKKGGEAIKILQAELAEEQERLLEKMNRWEELESRKNSEKPAG
ncbi:MAG: ABC-F family ATP-binding cassette domain-containing protein [Candidatus Binatia bacterium]|nr:ABC-F family ATP-binding cassette domain-containing protein [Candidatus Binatia bacterium]MDG1959670.1 ABC-F family ATP-binding cassette domain-containing protein [Candidatus Binatia bacterium]HAC80639.1 ABC transporter ATP-binding protein [Deltaproteobacteria bacterium]